MSQGRIEQVRQLRNVDQTRVDARQQGSKLPGQPLAHQTPGRQQVEGGHGDGLHTRDTSGNIGRRLEMSTTRLALNTGHSPGTGGTLSRTVKVNRPVRGP